MKTLLFLLVTGCLGASPLYVTTSISDQDWNRAELGAASPDVFVSQFMGLPGYEVEEFWVTREPHEDGSVCWIIWAEVSPAASPDLGRSDVAEPATLSLVLGALLLLVARRKREIL